MEVFNGVVSEGGMYVDLPSADYYAIQALSHVVVSNAGTDTMTATAYGSTDGGLTWTNHQTPLSVTIATRQLNVHFGSFVCTPTLNPAQAARLQRVRLQTSSSTLAHVRLLVTPRTKKPRRPQQMSAGDSERGGLMERDQQLMELQGYGRPYSELAARGVLRPGIRGVVGVAPRVVESVSSGSNRADRG